MTNKLQKFLGYLADTPRRQMAWFDSDRFMVLAILGGVLVWLTVCLTLSK